MFLPLLAIILSVHTVAALEGHPIDCVKNPTEFVCEYKVNE